ncbi:MAG: sigma-70 family RNA polymerase sigma factor [Deltaproteobacteria bacterium]|nr:sigma-70 family RNA polymerase sigma factor [Deltaproteobacteria bacterium]
MMERKLKLVSEEHSQDAFSNSDDELMLLSAAGRVDAFEALVARHYAMVCATASQYLGDDGLGKDVAQDTFLSIWNHCRHYVPAGRFKSYLVKVMFNFCHMMARSHKADRNRKESFHREQITRISTPDAPLDVLMRSEMGRLVQEQLVRLPQKERKVLLLRYGQGMSIAEAADLMDIPIGTAKSHAARGLKRLHKKLKRKSV